MASADAHGVATEHTTGGTRRRCTVVHRVEHGYVGKRRHYRSGLKAFEERTAMELAARALTQAVQIAAAAPVTRRTTPVVFAPAVGAAFFHELVGHAAEADNLAAPDSYLARLLDRRVTDSGLVVIDDPALEDGFGSMAVDDEGAPAQPVRLIDRGVVSGSLNSLRTRGGGARNGHGRRASFRAPALPRATNLVIGPGPAGPADLTAPGAGELLLISALGAGGVHPHSGEFLFTASEAYLITKQGRRPLRDVHLTGMATDALARLTAIGSDGATDSAACLKRGQAIGVGFSSPSIRFDELTWWS
ncbi:TldD/PmbA family protein [Streptomyces sp. NPDC051913]|uniref:TldD/PmbA family protein n=1 Tax=Streptomyces sp. NPDC051913 TaxID=3365676 RepID=UPI0037CEC4E6